MSPTHIDHHRRQTHAPRAPEPVSVGPSILRLSVAQRLGLAGALIAALWAGVYWVLA